MLVDLVIDTNVLAHCVDLREPRRHYSMTLVSKLLDSSTHLCVDEGFDLDAAKNKSAICTEYVTHLRFGDPGLALIVNAAQNRRLKQLPRRANLSVANKINRMIRNRVDRTFLNVAYNSKDRVLVSHDFVDFQQPKRTAIRKEFGIHICEACDCVALCNE